MRIQFAAIFGVLLYGASASAVRLTETTDEGRACFEIRTAAATYFYDKAGAGFTSIVDRDGNDWVGFHPEGSAPNGQSGWYRGIPNMGLDAFGHPGYEGATSKSNDPRGVDLDVVTIDSRKGGWWVTWSFTSTHAKMTIHAVEENYWLLYEGTPGGAVGSDDRCVRSDGSSIRLDQAFEAEIAPSATLPGVEWVYFADGTLDRSLFFAHDDDDKIDRYYLMSPMTVFGFGRHKANLDRLLDATPATLVIGLVDSRDASRVEQAVAQAFNETVVVPDFGRPAMDSGAPRDVGATQDVLSAVDSSVTTQPDAQIARPDAASPIAGDHARADDAAVPIPRPSNDGGSQVGVGVDSQGGAGLRGGCAVDVEAEGLGAAVILLLLLCTARCARCFY